MRRPGDHILPPGKMQKGHFSGKNQARGFGHRIIRELRLGCLQPPYWMMDLAAINSFSCRRVQAIALGQEMRERPGLRLKAFADWPISSGKRSARRAPVPALTFVLNPIIVFVAGHSRTEIRQVKREPGSSHRYGICRIQAEKPDPRLPLCRYIRPNV